MGYSFDSAPLERACRYRKRADALLDLSLNAHSTEATIIYLDIATGWLALARGLETQEVTCH